MVKSKLKIESSKRKLLRRGQKNYEKSNKTAKYYRAVSCAQKGKQLQRHDNQSHTKYGM